MCLETKILCRLAIHQEFGLFTQQKVNQRKCKPVDLTETFDPLIERLGLLAYPY